ncbi:uncharacterized protein SOCEGT47_081040 [Sorangium cellulosum]|uniref:Uncharacterized protein n=1 Tax=Sorangium cellulosum TaxID=56 RepID=A0A4P2QEA8_SORCE|nr:uncharacterized protein SOCEGT47_081040 [Sorangium cellulosum]
MQRRCRTRARPDVRHHANNPTQVGQPFPSAPDVNPLVGRKLGRHVDPQRLGALGHGGSCLQSVARTREGYAGGHRGLG